MAGVPPTRRSVELCGINMFRVQGGRVVEQWAGAGHARAAPADRRHSDVKSYWIDDDGGTWKRLKREKSSSRWE
jgi:hypothetical protein